jgi:hypothetical protein
MGTLGASKAGTIPALAAAALLVALLRPAGAIGRAAVDRARVVFRHAEAARGDGPVWQGACRFGPTVFRDVYACVERGDDRIRQVGASPGRLTAEDPCQVPGGTPLPPVAAAPLGGPAVSP